MTTAEIDQHDTRQRAQQLQSRLTRIVTDANLWSVDFAIKTGNTSMNLVNGPGMKVGEENFLQRAAMKAARLWALSQFDSYRNELDEKVREWRTATGDINRFLVEHDQERVEISAPVTHIPDRNTAYDNEDWMDAAIEAFSGLNDAFMRAEEAFERMKTRLASIAQPST